MVDITNLFGVRAQSSDGRAVQFNVNRIDQLEGEIANIKSIIEQIAAQVVIKSELEELKSEILSSLSGRDDIETDQTKSRLDNVSADAEMAIKLCNALEARTNNIDAELDRLSSLEKDIIEVRAAVNQLRPVTPTRKLSKSQQEIYDLIHNEGLTQREVAVRLGKDESVVSRLVARIRRYGYQT